MSDSHSVQFIRFDCKICGRTFSRVPYEHILQHRIAQCSSCGSRFILDREELQAALTAAQNEAERKTPAGSAPAEPAAVSKPEELTLDDGFEIGASRIYDAGEGLEIEEFLDFGDEEPVEPAETSEIYPDGGGEVLRIDEEPAELEAEEALAIEEPVEHEAEESLEIEEPAELEAEEALAIEEPAECEAEDRLAAGVAQETAAPGMPLPAFFEQVPAVPCVPLKTEPGEAVSVPCESERARTGFEPEKEDKLEFARRLSRLIPEGWVNLTQPFAPVSPEEEVPDMHSGEQQRQFLVFALGTTECAVPVENTTEIGLVPQLTRVPNVPGWLLGIANLRGDIVSLVDIGQFLGLGPFEPGTHDRMIMLRSSMDDLCTAVIVNRIDGMHHVAGEDILLNDAGGRDSEPYISGLYEREGRSIVILDIESMLLSDDMQQFRAL